MSSALFPRNDAVLSDTQTNNLIPRYIIEEEDHLHSVTNSNESDQTPNTVESTAFLYQLQEIDACISLMAEYNDQRSLSGKYPTGNVNHNAYLNGNNHYNNFNQYQKKLQSRRFGNNGMNQRNIRNINNSHFHNNNNTYIPYQQENIHESNSHLQPSSFIQDSLNFNFQQQQTHPTSSNHRHLFETPLARSHSSPSDILTGPHILNTSTSSGFSSPLMASSTSNLTTLSSPLLAPTLGNGNSNAFTRFPQLASSNYGQLSNHSQSLSPTPIQGFNTSNLDGLATPPMSATLNNPISSIWNTNTNTNTSIGFDDLTKSMSGNSAFNTLFLNTTNNGESTKNSTQGSSEQGDGESGVNKMSFNNGVDWSKW